MRKLLQRAGVSITRYPAPNTLSWQLKRVISERHIDHVIDVGAHEGGFAGLLREECKYVGRITSFEPSSESWTALAHNRSNDRMWTGHNLALGAATDILELHKFGSSDFNSFLHPNEIAEARFGVSSSAETERVDVRRLDELVELTSPTLLKVDTQGHDLEVLKGATGVLNSVEAVLVELPVQPIYVGAPDLFEISLQLRTWGFQLLGLFPLSRDTDRLSVIEFDGVFLRTRG